MSDDPGIELVMNGRIHTHAVELATETARGRFPEPLWIRDVERPEVTCWVSFVGDGPVLPPGAWFPDGVRGALAKRFSIVLVDEGFAIYDGRAP
jgi:hypothetical protein